jgi:hypothetical protein
MPATPMDAMRVFMEAWAMGEVNFIGEWRCTRPLEYGKRCSGAGLLATIPPQVPEIPGAAGQYEASLP